MDAAGPDEVSRILARARQGDEEALDDLLPLVYDVLRRLSHRERRRVGGDATLSTTGLIHEAYLKLAPGTGVRWEDRAHFFRVAARAMRQVLVDRARRRATRGRERERIQWIGLHPDPQAPTTWDDLLTLDQALDRLEARSGRLHSVVELRFFAGLTEEEVASTLGVSARTVRRDWTKARLFLHREMYPEGDPA
jgi:RNA polymerase sigma factor (TIGR02999 family)